MNEFQQSYYDWLYESVTANTKSNHSQLIAKLWDKEYYALIPNDDNRGEDGRNLRYFYVTEIMPKLTTGLDDLNDLEAFGACRCLEMLIALSKRMEDALYGSPHNKTWQDLFWEMMKNLGLERFHDGRYDTDIHFQVDKVLNRWLERGYGRDGIGGLFPLARPLKNQSKVEIWYQMMAYIDVNYPI